MQLYLLGRKAPRFGEDLIVQREQLQHPVQIAGQQILAADLEHPGEVVHLLEPSHVAAEVDAHERIRPADVPQVGLADQPIAEPFAHARDNVVAAV